MPKKDEYKQMTDSNIQPPSDPNAHVHADGTTGWATETTPNPIPGTEVTQSPGLIPETTSTTEYDPASANVDTAVPPTTEGRPDLGPDTTAPPTNYPETVVPPTETGTEWDGTIAPPPYTAGQPDITEVPPTDYAAAVDHQVDSMPSSTPSEYYTKEDGNYNEAMSGTKATAEEAHKQMMGDPHYAVHIHERQLEQLAKMIEEIAERLLGLEAKVMDMEQAQMGVNDNNPIADYPEVQMHQNK